MNTEPTEAGDQYEKLVTAYAAVPPRIFIVTLMSRPGALALLPEVEHAYFPPGTPSNEHYDNWMLLWPQPQPLGWAVMAAPPHFESKIRELCHRRGLTLPQATPVCLGNKVYVAARPHQLAWARELGAEVFPIAGERVFTVESPGKAALRLDERQAIKAAVQECDRVEAKNRALRS